MKAISNLCCEWAVARYTMLPFASVYFYQVYLLRTLRIKCCQPAGVSSTASNMFELKKTFIVVV